jgi:hypothetical protein
MHDPTFHVGKMEVRPSGKGNYTGLTVIVRATSREMLDKLYRELSAHPMVKIVYVTAAGLRARAMRLAYNDGAYHPVPSFHASEPPCHP